MIFLILITFTGEGRASATVPHYIPMPTLEICEGMKPLIVQDMGSDFKILQPSGMFSHSKNDGSVKERIDTVTVMYGGKIMFAECREYKTAD